MTAVGRNSVGGNSLKSIVDRIERLNDERDVLGADIREVYAEAKGSGFAPKIIRKIIALRKKSAEARHEEEALMDTYMNALGMTPLEKAIKDADAKA